MTYDDIKNEFIDGFNYNKCLFIAFHESIPLSFNGTSQYISQQNVKVLSESFLNNMKFHIDTLVEYNIPFIIGDWLYCQYNNSNDYKLIYYDGNKYIIVLKNGIDSLFDDVNEMFLSLGEYDIEKFNKLQIMENV